MPEYTKVKFTSTVIPLDGGTFHECVFDRCVLVYSGLGPLNLDRCRLVECRWSFSGPAGNVIKLLADFSRSGSGMETAAESILDSIKNGKLDSGIPSMTNPSMEPATEADFKPNG